MCNWFWYENLIVWSLLCLIFLKPILSAAVNLSIGLHLNVLKIVHLHPRCKSGSLWTRNRPVQALPPTEKRKCQCVVFVWCLWGVARVCEVFVRCLWGVCEVFVRCLWGVCVAFVWCLWGVCKVFVWCLWGVRVVFVRCSYGVRVVFVWCLWGVCVVFVRCSCGVCVVLVWCFCYLAYIISIGRSNRDFEFRISLEPGLPINIQSPGTWIMLRLLIVLLWIS